MQERQHQEWEMSKVDEYWDYDPDKYGEDLPFEPPAPKTPSKPAHVIKPEIIKANERRLNIGYEVGFYDYSTSVWQQYQVCNTVPSAKYAKKKLEIKYGRWFTFRRLA